MSESRRAIVLMSGGLDSSLAVRLIHDMGIDIIGVHFTGPFCLCNRGSGGCIHFARQQAEALGVSFETQPLGEAYLDIVVEPKYGRGSGMNPCVDCRVLMFSRAKLMMQERKASFIVSGEVLGQRPMSQLRDKLELIERAAGLEGRILRPLSAHHFAPTIPEQNGMVDREKLLNIAGRGRREQMDLAEKLAIGDYPCPAGGCLLTDKNFSARLREHLERSTLSMRDVSLLKAGRHFRLPDGSKLVVGRDEKENELLERLAGEDDMTLNTITVSGPVALLRGEASEETIRLAGEISGGYCGGEGDVEFAVGGAASTLTVKRMTRDAASIYGVTAEKRATGETRAGV